MSFALPLDLPLLGLAWLSTPHWLPCPRALCWWIGQVRKSVCMCMASAKAVKSNARPLSFPLSAQHVVLLPCVPSVGRHSLLCLRWDMIGRY